MSFDFLCLLVVCSCLLLHYFPNKLFPGSSLAASLSKASISCQLRTVAGFARICQIKVSLARHTLAAPTGFCHQRMNQKTCRTCKNCKTQVSLPRLQLQQVRHNCSFIRNCHPKLNQKKICNTCRNHKTQVTLAGFLQQDKLQEQDLSSENEPKTTLCKSERERLTMLSFRAKQGIHREIA